MIEVQLTQYFETHETLKIIVLFRLFIEFNIKYEQTGLRNINVTCQLPTLCFIAWVICYLESSSILSNTLDFEHIYSLIQHFFFPFLIETMTFGQKNVINYTTVHK